jgi:hypothetical protein
MQNRWEAKAQSLHSTHRAILRFVQIRCITSQFHPPSKAGRNCTRIQADGIISSTGRITISFPASRALVATPRANNDGIAQGPRRASVLIFVPSPVALGMSWTFLGRLDGLGTLPSAMAFCQCRRNSWNVALPNLQDFPGPPSTTSSQDWSASAWTAGFLEMLSP